MLFGYEFGAELGWTDVEDESFGNPAAMRINRDTEPVQAFQTAMDDDFNTAGALAVLFELAKDLRRAGNLITHAGKADRESNVLRQQWQTLVCLAQVLGLEAHPGSAQDIQRWTYRCRNRRTADPAESGTGDEELWGKRSHPR